MYSKNDLMQKCRDVYSVVTDRTNQKIFGAIMFGEAASLDFIVGAITLISEKPTQMGHDIILRSFDINISTPLEVGIVVSEYLLLGLCLQYIWSPEIQNYKYERPTKLSDNP